MSRDLPTNAQDHGIALGDMQADGLSLSGASAQAAALDADPLALGTTAVAKTTRKKKTETE